MIGAHNTPIGSPAVLAPGKIPLIGEFAIVEEGFGVVAAITRYAKAQFVPCAARMPRLVAEVVRLTQVRFGEVLMALPPGSVLVNDEDFRINGQLLGLGLNAATAVAAAGALLETIGCPMENRKSLIFNIADASRRAIQGDVGSGADTLAATYGGLVQVSCVKGVISQVLPLDSPDAMHLVLFSAGPSIAPQRVVEGLERYKRSAPADFTDRSRVLRDLSRRFVDEVSAKRATGAISTAGRYGDELADLSTVAQVPIVTEVFARASEMARDLGGVAKPTGTGGGQIGVAIFTSSEAAQLFRKACSKSVTLLEGDWDQFGVRCESPLGHPDAKTIEIPSFPTPSPEPEPGDSLSRGEIVTVAPVLEQMDTAPTKIDGVTTLPRGLAAGHFRRQILPIAMITSALLLFAWFALPDVVRAGFLHLDLPRTGDVRRMGAGALLPPTHPVKITALPQAVAESAQPTTHPTTEAPPPEPPAPLPPPKVVAPAPARPAPSRPAHKKESSRSLHSSSRTHQPSASVLEQTGSPLRSGRLSLDDF